MASVVSWYVCRFLVPLSVAGVVHGVAVVSRRPASGRRRLRLSVHRSYVWAVCGLLESHGAEGAKAFKQFTIDHALLSAADVTSETNINVFLMDMLTAFKAGAIPTTCFRLESEYTAYPPGRPNQIGDWKSHRLFIDPEQTISALRIYLAKQRGQITLSRNDLRAQLSKTSYWIEGKLKKRFGEPGKTTPTWCWGFHLDRMEGLGYCPCTDEDYQKFLQHPEEGDPRKGPFFAIVEALESEMNSKEI